MRTRIVHITRKSSGQAVVRESLLDTASVRIGRGNDNDIQLIGLTLRLHHAVIEPSPGGARITAAGGAEVWVDGVLVAEAALPEGTMVRLGPHELRRLPPRANEDLCLSVETLAEPGADTLVTRRTPHFSVRRLSWLLSVTTVVMFVVLPVGVTGMKTWFSSGPLTRSHAHLGDACASCHTVPFSRVQDVACTTCHQETGSHVGSSRSQPSRCGVCHTEHRGMPSLGWVDQSHCVDCHADASDFGTQHPELRPLVVNDLLAEPRRVPWSPRIAEQSGLRFNHLRHVGQLTLDPTSESRGVLRCDRCHQRADDGGLMQPVSFAKHCQGCHRLSFDDADAQREVVHDTPEKVRADVVAYYTGSSGEESEQVPSPGSPQVGVNVRARPGSSPTRRGSDSPSPDIDARVERALAFLLDDRAHQATCLVCHVRKSGLGANIRLSPVRVVAERYPLSRFRHDSHMSVGCRSCHPAVAVFDPDFAPDEVAPSWAQTGVYQLVDPDKLFAQTGLRPSTSASDVNLPGIASCRTCHTGGGGGESRVASDCFLCHDYHGRPTRIEDPSRPSGHAQPSDSDDLLRY